MRHAQPMSQSSEAILYASIAPTVTTLLFVVALVREARQRNRGHRADALAEVATAAQRGLRQAGRPAIARQFSTWQIDLVVAVGKLGIHFRRKRDAELVNWFQEAAQIGATGRNPDVSREMATAILAAAHVLMQDRRSARVEALRIAKARPIPAGDPERRWWDIGQ